MESKTVRLNNLKASILTALEKSNKPSYYGSLEAENEILAIFDEMEKLEIPYLSKEGEEYMLKATDREQLEYMLSAINKEVINQ